MSKHHLNPFDFVPFAADKDPDLKTVTEWRDVDSRGLVTGYLELQLQALTPVHIVGWQESEPPDGRKILMSHFCRLGGRACIPGSSIRGMLRTFIEAASSGWVSQITPYYLKEKNRRNLAFRVVEENEEFKSKGGKIDKALNFSLPQQFVPQPGIKGPVDLASYLFGYVSPEKKGHAWRGAVSIEDAIIENDNFANYEMPDIAGKAFMGNPNPSAKTWWYHLPYAIRKRRSQVKRKTFTVIEFLGEQFRGRKFYYHQDPTRTVPEYKDKDWKSLYRFKLGCMTPDQKSELFRIYFEEIPLALLYLLVWALSPGKRLRHKIGYGKAYGFGTILFELVNCNLRASSLTGTAQQSSSSFFEECKTATWNESTIRNKGLFPYLDWPRLQYLSRILYYKEPLNLIFTYPKFTKWGGGFLPQVMNSNLTEALETLKIKKRFKNDIMKVTPDEAYRIAKELNNEGIKPALHFEVYQQNSPDYTVVHNRRIEDAI